MKSFTKYLAVFCCSILLGVMVIVLFPVESRADDIGPCNGYQLDPACIIIDYCAPRVTCETGYYHKNYEARINTNCQGLCIYWEGCVFECMPH